MMREGLNKIQAHSESTAMVGDRMDTDVLCGLEAGLQTFLVLTGVTQATDIDRYPYRPSTVVPSVAELIPYIDRGEIASEPRPSGSGPPVTARKRRQTGTR